MASIFPHNMHRITIELLTEDAIQKVQHLEKLNIVRVISSEAPAIKINREWAGSLSKETAQRMLNSLDRSRSEWS